MIKYILKVFVKLVLLLICVSVICFTLIEVSPIDPINSYINASGVVSQAQKSEIAEYFQLDQPALIRLFSWFNNLLHLDLGISIIYRQPVIDIIADRFLGSLMLMLSSWVLSGIVGLTVGLIMGANSGKFIDKFLKSICLTLSSIPTFLLGIIFLFIFSVTLGWFPIGFSAPIGVLESEITLTHRLHHLILPSITLAFSSFAGIALHSREKLIEVLKSDYVLLSKSRGFSKREIIKRHGIRNILSPFITIQFVSLSEIFGGSILAETVFSYPGLGSTIVNAGLRGDVALFLGITLFSATFVFMGNLIANILYTFIDPKLRLKYTKQI